MTDDTTDQDGRDVTGKVLVCEDAHTTWEKIVAGATLAAQERGIESISETRVDALPDGTLRLWVQIPTGPAVFVIVAAGDWTWRQ